MFKKVVVILLGAGALLVLGLVLWIGPRNVIGILTYGRQRREGTLVVGNPAPLVELIDRDGVSRRSLAEWVGPRPLVLVFGSFT